MKGGHLARASRSPRAEIAAGGVEGGIATASPPMGPGRRPGSQAHFKQENSINDGNE